MRVVFRPARALAFRRSSIVTITALALALTFGLLSSGPALPSATAAPVFNAPLSIATDCSVDVSEQLATWLDSLPDNAIAVLRPGACYRNEVPVLVREAVGLTIDGNGATFKRTRLTPDTSPYAGGNRHLWFKGGRNLTVRNLRVEGINTKPDSEPGFASFSKKYEFEHALAFHGVQGVVVQNVTVYGVWGDGIWLGAKPARPEFLPTSNVLISNVTIDLNGRQGIAMTEANGVLIDNVKILRSRRAGIDLEPPADSRLVTNVEIRNSYIRSNLFPIASYGSGRVENIYIHHNTIDRAGSGLWVHVKAPDYNRRRNWTIHDNRLLYVVAAPDGALIFTNVDNVDIRRNISPVSLKRSRIAVKFNYAGGALAVIDNDFTGACAPYVTTGTNPPVTASGNIITTSGCGEAR